MYKNKPYDVIVIGGGPAGMMAAGEAAVGGARTLLIDKNRELGAKLLLTGKGRCNLTNDKSLKEFIHAFGENGPFLYSALTQFSNEDVREFFESRGLKVTLEQGGRYFPMHGDAQNVLHILTRHVREHNVTVLPESPVLKIEHGVGNFRVYVKDKGTFITEKVIITTGGRSYTSTGSTGDGYAFAYSLGHSIVDTEPALVPLISKNEHIRSLQGLSLKNIELTMYSVIGRQERKEFSLFGEMLFTHFGISGPIVLSMSHDVFTLIKDGKKVIASIDFKPALDADTLDNRLQRELLENSKKTVVSVLRSLLPAHIVSYFSDRVPIELSKKCAEVSREERQDILRELKDFRFEITSTLPTEAGIITSGGIKLSELNPKTLESKLIPGLYFAGEVLDLQGPSGGYNLTVAFSTGFVAGKAAARTV